MPTQNMGRIMPARFEDSPIQPATVGARLAREAAAPIFLTLRAVNFAGKPRSNRFCVLIVPTLRVVMRGGRSASLVDAERQGRHAHAEHGHDQICV